MPPIVAPWTPKLCNRHEILPIFDLPKPSSGRSALIATTSPKPDELVCTHANSNRLAPGKPQSSRKVCKRARGASYASKASKGSAHFELTYRAPRSLPFCDDETRFWARLRCP